MFQNVMLDAALHISCTIIREDQRGNSHDAERAYTRLNDLIERQDDPDNFLLSLARKLGRERSRMIPLSEEVMECACY